MFIDFENTKPFNQGVDAASLFQWVNLRLSPTGSPCSQLLSLVLVLPAKVSSGANFFVVVLADD
jgi:hypothetical protein